MCCADYTLYQIHVGDDTLQLDGAGNKITVAIGARLVQANHNPAAPLIIRYDYMGLPASAEQWSPTSPLPDDECRNDIAHNTQTAGLRWLPEYATVSRAPGVAGVAALPNNPASRRQNIIAAWTNRFVVGTANAASYDYA